MGQVGGVKIALRLGKVDADAAQDAAPLLLLCALIFILCALGFVTLRCGGGLTLNQRRRQMKRRR